MPIGVKTPRVHARSTYSARFDADENHARRGRLYLERGAWRRTVDKDGEHLGDMRDPGAVCVANIGDKLVLAGPSIEETAMARVETVYPDGASMYVAILHGQIAPSTTRVHVMKYALKPEQREMKFARRK
jgi:hypothetical protein